MNNILFLGSKSKSRQELLTQAGINFKIVAQDAQEDYKNLDKLEEIVSVLAARKMEHVILEKAPENKITYVLTADSLCQNNKNQILGKPKNHEEILYQIRTISSGITLVSTAFCLEKRIFKSGNWHTQEQILQAVTTECIFKIPENLIDKYLAKTDAMNIAGSVSIENYGAQFLKEIRGSYSNIIGLPLFELREALEKLNFFAE